MLSSKYSCLARTDNTSPFRWMGVWCAVYAPLVQLKADRRPERARGRRSRHRSTNRRGKGSVSRRVERRAMARSARWRGTSLVPHILARRDHLVRRTNACEQRFVKYFERSLVSIARLTTEMESLGESLRKEYPRKSRLVSDRADFLENLAFSKYRGTVGVLERLILACMGRWGLPRDLALKRFRLIANPQETGIHSPILVMVGSGQSFLWQRPPFEAVDEYKWEAVRCSCNVCRLALLCPAGHYVDPGFINCRFCNFCRHDPATVRRPVAYRVREGNHAVRPPRTLTRAKANSSHPKGNPRTGPARIRRCGCKVGAKCPH